MTTSPQAQTPVVQNSRLLSLPLELRHIIYAQMIQNEGVHVDLSSPGISRLLANQGTRLDATPRTLHPPRAALICRAIWDEFQEFMKTKPALAAVSYVFHIRNFELDVMDIPQEVNVRNSRVIFRILIDEIDETRAIPLLQSLIGKAAFFRQRGHSDVRFAVHLGGLILDMDRLKQILLKVRLLLREDKKQAGMEDVKFLGTMLTRFERALMEAMRREWVERQENEGETRKAEGKTRAFFASLPFCKQMISPNV
ncbi:uncharacterized protein LTR77_004801 [Saxophila tyrrhenica]|uniref:Uncharacterized protein n=1 Tax=Saxophila tyrrhenica TaxID=1690608 RepID=A0AAV9PAT5_9PEZI|nr:hypothetical protein LTR77_004801 [Saxophila tyrrhenica]